MTRWIITAALIVGLAACSGGRTAVQGGISIDERGKPNGSLGVELIFNY